MTPKDMFEKMRAEGFRVDYERLPVTDEQAPIPRVFSRLEERVSSALRREDASLVFNCQMGCVCFHRRHDVLFQRAFCLIKRGGA
jgi:hypothetical protein